MHKPSSTAAHPATVPFFSPANVAAGIDVAASLQRVVASQSFVLGEEVRSFERAFADYLQTSDCVGVGNGTDALTLALQAAGAGLGKKVLMAANAGFYASTAAYSLGATPAYLDVAADTHLLDAATVQAALATTPAVAAIVVTHLYGNVADMPAICAAAKACGVVVIEDCAQAHGAALPAGKAGSFGELSCFSFYPTKNLGALGDGGAVSGKDPALLAKVRQLRQYGWQKKYEVGLRGGGNSRLDELQAAFLRDKLPGLDAANARRRAIIGQYHDLLVEQGGDLPDQSSGGQASSRANNLALTFVRPTTAQVAGHLCVVTTPKRDALARFLADRGIATAVHYPVPDHHQPAYRDLHAKTTLPVTEALCTQVLSLPCHPLMPSAHVVHVAAQVRAFFARKETAPS